MFVAGPFETASRRKFLCPICDEDRLEDLPTDPPPQCTAVWLQDQELVDSNRRGAEIRCLCFRTDPLPDSSLPEKRFWHYRHIALLLNGGSLGKGNRVDLPRCVLDRVEELYGDSRVGFSS